ncbi:MAG: hypothetical protein INR69_01055 [Mucilaginibacter polytrichastri]|nr:hypothetical protein [Mucilaginibacter polytrichastri]
MKKILVAALVITGMAFASCDKGNEATPSSAKVNTQAKDRTRTTTFDGD